MNDNNHPNDDLDADDDLTEDDFVEIDWEPLQAAIEAMADEGLDLDDLDAVRDHLAALLASFLRRVKVDTEADDDDVAEIAAEVAGMAAQIALGEEEVPDFVAFPEDVS